jgi:hypothetical protein
MNNFKKNHETKMTKTLETNITSEKSKSNSQTQVAQTTQNNNLSRKNNIYLRQYQKYFNKKLVIKYNILPNEYNLMKLDNFITAKYCHSLASFKEKLIFNYDEEFLNQFYDKKESIKKIPLFSEFYKSYLLFFCFPTLAELRLNDLIEDMVEKKAKAFYNENFSEPKEKNSEKKIKVVIFTNKIRQDISRRNSLTNLTKTTIKNNSVTNKSSVSLATIEKIFNELNYEKKLGNKSSKNNLKKNNSNSLNKGMKNSVIIQKLKKKIKNEEKTKDNTNVSNKIKNKNNISTEGESSIKNKKVKNKISRNIQNKLLENKTSTLNFQKLVTIQKNAHSILKLNTKNNFTKNIHNPLDNNQRTTTTNSKNKSNNILIEKYKIKDIKNKINSKNGVLLTNYNVNSHNSILKIYNTNFNLQDSNNNNHYNFTISNSKNNSNRNIKKKTIKVIKKPSIQKIKQINQIKSRNYKSSIAEMNSIYSTKNNIIHQNSSRENVSDYYTLNNKNLNSISIKLTSNKKSKQKIKLSKADNKINSNRQFNLPQNNGKFYNFISGKKNNTGYFYVSKTKKGNAPSSSLKNLNDKNKAVNDIRKIRVIDSKNNTQINTNSYVLYDSQSLIKNLKVTGRENSINLLNDYKIKITKNLNKSPTSNDIQKINTFKNYCKK